MRNPDVTYTPGQSLAVIRPGIWALIDMAVDDARVNTLWEASAQSLDDLLDVLLRDGLRRLPGFVIVASEGTELRYAIRAPGTLEIDELQADPRLDASGTDSWVGGRLNEPPARLNLHIGSAASGVALPTAEGMASASALQIYLDRSSPANPKPPAEVETELEPTDAARSGLERLPVADPTSEGLPSIDESATAPEEPTSESHASTYFQLLNSSTMERDALLSKLRAADDHEAGDQPPEASEPPATLTDQKPTSEATGVWTDHDDANRLPSRAQLPTQTEGVIDGLPWQSHAPAAPTAAEPVAEQSLPSFTPPGPTSAPLPLPPASAAAAPEVPVEKFDSMSVTINRAALRKQLEKDRETGPTIFALRCSAGHLSPTYVATCRVCGVELGEQEPIEVVRPALGQLVLSNGSTVILDKGVVFGRFPQSEVEDPAQRPNLVRLIDSAEISRMHASVMLDGWQVLLRDLGSQNGTILTLPGKAPEQIRPNEDYILEPGSVVSFADVVTCRFEVSE